MDEQILLPFTCRRCGQLTMPCEACPAPVDAIACPCGGNLCTACAPAYVDRRGQVIETDARPLFEFPRGIFGQQELGS